MFHPAMYEERTGAVRFRCPLRLSGPPAEDADPVEKHLSALVSRLRDVCRDAGNDSRAGTLVFTRERTGNTLRLCLSADGKVREITEIWSEDGKHLSQVRVTDG